ncbi:hypothetical protein [Jannaschia sp. LMIT008]|uniref:hypothetical protein n=1 Tax=Jannaschia maritima TaxID=3032585 RepID=UPI002811C377|nr:hypothetical protein [Jannaschia sp. LMIT008]
MTKTKTILAALVLTAAPLAAAAQGCNYDKYQQAQSCAPGSSWNADEGKCLADANA